MATITRITTQTKHKQRYNIYLDYGTGETFGFGIDEAILIDYRLYKGMELDETTIANLMNEDTKYKAYSLAINFLSYRMRTKNEVYEHLQKKDIHPEHIDHVIQRLEQESLLDDRQFALRFTESRIQTSAKGPMLVKKELLDKGIAATYAEEAVQLYTYEIQYEQAVKWMEKRLNTSKRDSFQQQLQKLHGFLMQKGFTQDVIQSILDAANQKQDSDAEWDALVFHGEKLIRKHHAKYEGWALKNKVKEGLYRKGFSLDMINTFIEDDRIFTGQ